MISNVVDILLGRSSVKSSYVILAVAVFWVAVANFSFLSVLLQVYPLTFENAGFLVSVLVGFTALLVFGLALLCHRYTMKPITISLLIASAFAAYFMDSYHVIIDEQMVGNIFTTDTREAIDLLSPTMALYVVLIGLLPAWLVYRTKIHFQPFKREIVSNLKLVGLSLSVMVGMFFLFSPSYTSFFREHKEIRAYFNPGNFVYGTARFVGRWFEADTSVVYALGQDAAVREGDGHRELIIMVVGETARADRFSLNGYERETNPLLQQEDVISFTNFMSCGTLTAISVPCMFSIYRADEYSAAKVATRENALDVLTHAGVNVLWRDNNSSSKGVADRVPYQDYRAPTVNPVCDIECRDVGMLDGLQDYIDANPEGDILVVLHQMGNHGPAYYKRYPEEFEKFKPTCQTNELSDCTSEEIDNAYDNAILYTDYFLAQTIDLLKQNESEFETAMMYVSDHGESLGEFGLYLHGMPNFMAPTSQRQVPVILWLGESYHDADPEEIRARRDEQFTHDNVFHTLLGFMEIESAVYDPSMDIFQTRTEGLARPRPSSPSSSIAVSSPPIEDTLVE